MCTLTNFGLEAINYIDKLRLDYMLLNEIAKEVKHNEERKTTTLL